MPASRLAYALARALEVFVLHRGRAHLAGADVLQLHGRGHHLTASK